MKDIKYIKEFVERQKYEFNDTLDFLLNVKEMVPILISSNKFNIYSFIVPKDNICNNYHEKLMKWNFTAKPDRYDYESEIDILDNSIPVFFPRFFSGYRHSYILEMNQVISHALEIFWLEEKKAFCNINELGDYEFIATMDIFGENNFFLCTIRKKELNSYLFNNDMALIRFFAIDIQRSKNIEEKYKSFEQEIFATRNYLPFLGCEDFRGFQIIRPSTPIQTEKRYASFIILDFRHNKIQEWSCDPKMLGNYNIQSEFPFDTSPAFFRSEVLARYKSDPSKYIIEYGMIDCRRQWTIHYDINEEGQVFTYIKELSFLPYSEQLYWKSFNEEPRAGISKRAIEQDFKGKWYSGPLSVDSFLNDHTNDILKFEEKYRQLKKDHNHLKNWLSNFKSYNEMDIAFKLLKEVEFYSLDKIRLKLKNLHEKLKACGVDVKNSIFLGLGRGGKSGQHILYLYRTRSTNAEEIITKDGSDIFNEDPIELSKKTIVFVDDFIGVNGKQAIRYLKEFFNRPSEMEKNGVIDQERKKYLDEILLKISKYYLAIVGFQTGIDQLKNESNIKILVEDILTDKQKAFSLERNIFGNKEKTEIAREVIKRIGEKIYPEGPLGWEGNEALIVFNYNTPTNTLPIFWSDGTLDHKWCPLFERYDVKKINVEELK